MEWKACLSQFATLGNKLVSAFTPLAGHILCFDFHQPKAERRIGNVVSTYTELGCDCSISLDLPAGESTQYICSRTPKAVQGKKKHTVVLHSENPFQLLSSSEKG